MYLMYSAAGVASSFQPVSSLGIDLANVHGLVIIFIFIPRSPVMGFLSLVPYIDLYYP